VFSPHIKYARRCAHIYYFLKKKYIYYFFAVIVMATYHVETNLSVKTKLWKLQSEPHDVDLTARLE
jgi:hypothetical protein